jgi:hypothetical protein
MNQQVLDCGGSQRIQPPAGVGSLAEVARRFPPNLRRRIERPTFRSPRRGLTAP